MKKTKLRIDIYEYTDYQAFLKAAYEDLHAQDTNFSYRYLQKKAGYSAQSNHFWQVANGRTALTESAARRYGQALGLSPKETQFLATLAAMQQAKTDKDRNFCIEQLKQFATFRQHYSNGLVRHEFYSEWFLPALRELVALDHFKEDPEWIAGQLKPAITPAQAKRGIQKLIQFGFLKRDEDGRLLQSEPIIGSYTDRKDSDELVKVGIRNYHRKMIGLGSEAIEGFPQNDRYVVGTTMAISRSQAEELKEMIQDFMLRVQAHIAKDEPIERVYRLNAQFFPLMEDEKGKAAS